ncbi:MAG TPA: SDR family NAD(P)-dependent oxidoreductase, partial [Puia sp.]|nr:SDR family NAD(P)-dependent oxidoreductase [Puia sp.]
MDNKNKIALLTGGSRGLGKNMALSLAREGIDVILTYNSKKEEALAVVAEVGKLGAKASALQLNTGDVKSFDTFFGQVKAELKNTFGADRFDFLINNAGVGVHSPFAETTEEDFDMLVNIQFKGVYFLTQKALPLINDGGRIINLSTGLARFATPGYSA